MISLLLAALLAVQDDALKRAVAEAKAELATEQARIRKEEAAQEQELAAVRDEVAKRAAILVDRASLLSGKQKELEVLRAERTRLRQVRVEGRQAESDLRRIATDANQKLSELLSALPPSESRAEQLKIRDRLKDGLDALPFLELASLLLREIRTVAVFPHPVRTRDGSLEDSRVLRAGMIFTGFETKSGKVGEVFAPPPGADGYRWNESLPPWAAEDIKRALSKADALPLDLPLDVTQSLSPDRRDQGKSPLETLKAGGIIMIPLCAVGLLGVLVVVERFCTLAARGGARDAEVRAVLDACRAGDFDGAERRAKAGKGTVLRSLAAALGRRASGRVGMEDAVREAMLHEMPALERFLALLAVLAGIAPMLGLLGTVTGMITTFDMIRLFGSGDPGVMAGGISEALVATAAGLIVAVPMLFFHSWFSGRVDRILADAQRHATTLVNVVCGQREGEVVNAR